MEKLIVISCISGCGKHSVLENLLKDKGLNLRFPISTTSRQMRGAEENGVSYYFITPNEFREKIKNDEFLEYEEIYDGCFYGTEMAELGRGDSTVILEMDSDLAWNIKQKYKDRVLIIFIRPDSIASLRERLRARESESEKSIEERIRRAQVQIEKSCRFDYVVTNDDIERCVNKITRKIKEFLALPEFYCLKKDVRGIDAICEILSVIDKKQCGYLFYGIPLYIYRGVSAFTFQKDSKSPMVSTGHTIKSGLSVRLERTYGTTEKGCSHANYVSKLNELIANAKREFPHKYAHCSELEVLADIQHNGGATCLIDFSKNILIALWFACQNDFDSDALLYCYNIKPDLAAEALAYVQRQEKAEIGKLLNTETKIKNVTNRKKSLFYLWQPSVVNNRIVRQDSVFLFGLDDLHVPDHDVFVIRIDAEKKPSIKDALAAYFNISEETVFNDEIGMAVSNSKLKPYKVETDSVMQYYQDALQNIRNGYYSNALELLKRYQGNIVWKDLRITQKINVHYYLAVCYKHLSFCGEKHYCLHNALQEYDTVTKLERELYLSNAEKLQEEENRYCCEKIVWAYSELVTLCYILEHYYYGMQLCRKLLEKNQERRTANSILNLISVRKCTIVGFELQVLYAIQKHQAILSEYWDSIPLGETYSNFETLLMEYYKLICRIFNFYIEKSSSGTIANDIHDFQKKIRNWNFAPYQGEIVYWDFSYIKNAIETALPILSVDKSQGC